MDLRDDCGLSHRVVRALYIPFMVHFREDMSGLHIPHVIILHANTPCAYAIPAKLQDALGFFAVQDVSLGVQVISHHPPCRNIPLARYWQISMCWHLSQVHTAT